MKFHFSQNRTKMLAIALAAMIPLTLAAQSAPPAKGASAQDSASKWDIFIGYSYLDPFSGKIPNAPHESFGSTYGQINWGGIGSVAHYFNRNVGVELVGDGHIQSEDWPLGDNAASYNSNDDMAGGSAGLIYRLPGQHFTPFAHVLGGVEEVGNVYQSDAAGLAITGGLGLDVNLSKHFAWRLAQADYQFIHANSADIDVFRVSTGAVLRLGSFTPPPPVTLACSASPSWVFPGDPITVTATAGSLDPKLNAVYSWSGTAVTGTGTTVTVATGALAAGSYTVKGEVKEGKPGKEGLKPGQTADCSASFTVKAFEPPTLTCSASPTTLNPGDTSTITAIGVSPQNRPLTYSYSASAGNISGTGTTAAFSSTGAPTGAVGITCNVTDDKGQTATATTSVNIAAPYVKPAPHVSALCSITFDKDEKRPSRVDNEAKACLDQVTQALKSDPSASVVVVGEATAKEKEPKKGKHAMQENLAAQRAINTKDYLVTEEQSGIDASRVSVRTGATDGKTVEDYLVPSGATFDSDVTGTTLVDETVAKPQPRKPLAGKHHRKMKM